METQSKERKQKSFLMLRRSFCMLLHKKWEDALVFIKKSQSLCPSIEGQQAEMVWRILKASTEWDKSDMDWYEVLQLKSRDCSVVQIKKRHEELVNVLKASAGVSIMKREMRGLVQQALEFIDKALVILTERLCTGKEDFQRKESLSNNPRELKQRMCGKDIPKFSPNGMQKRKANYVEQLVDDSNNVDRPVNDPKYVDQPIHDPLDFNASEWQEKDKEYVEDEQRLPEEDSSEANADGTGKEDARKYESLQKKDSSELNVNEMRNEGRKNEEEKETLPKRSPTPLDFNADETRESSGDISKGENPLNRTTLQFGGIDFSPFQDKSSKTFWTACNFCHTQYEYDRSFEDRRLLCKTCKKPFVSVEALRVPIQLFKQIYGCDNSRDMASSSVSQTYGCDNLRDMASSDDSRPLVSYQRKKRKKIPL